MTYRLTVTPFTCSRSSIRKNSDQQSCPIVFFKKYLFSSKESPFFIRFLLKAIVLWHIDVDFNASEQRYTEITRVWAVSRSLLLLYHSSNPFQVSKHWRMDHRTPHYLRVLMFTAHIFFCVSQTHILYFSPHDVWNTSLQWSQTTDARIFSIPRFLESSLSSIPSGRCINSILPKQLHFDRHWVVIGFPSDSHCKKKWGKAGKSAKKRKWVKSQSAKKGRKWRG